MWATNAEAENAGLPAVFTTMELGSQGQSKAYDSFQRKYLRSFNRWRNNGLLVSDAAIAGIYVAETADIWPNLDECGGRAAPEVDHVSPSYQQGANTYLNARLVSFQHNHMYREKKTLGAVPVSTKLQQLFRDSKVAFTKNRQSRYGRGDSSWVVDSRVLSKIEQNIPVQDDLDTLDAIAKLDELFNDDVLFGAAPGFHLQGNFAPDSLLHALRKNRQTFKKAAHQTLLRQQKETALDQKYNLSANRHLNAVRHFIQTAVLNHPERQRLKGLIDGAGIPLCAPSDELLDAGGGVGAAIVEVFPVMPDPTVEPAYQAAIGAMDTLKIALGV
jgi:cytochrome c551/c552